MNQNPFLKEWKGLEAAAPRPQFARNIIQMDFKELEEKVLSSDPETVKQLTESLYSGDAYILKTTFPKNFFDELKAWVYNYWMSTPSSFHKILEGCPNFHRLIDDEIAKNYAFKSIRRSCYFFSWNDAPLNMLEIIYSRWRVFKYIGGLSLDEYVRHTPKDGVVDRFQVAQYPTGGAGLSETHADPYLNQRLIMSGYMSKRGEDYEQGGFYVVDKNKITIDMENIIDIGDFGISYATVLHGVAPVDPHKKEVEWNKTSGRWWLGLYSIDSNEIQNRHTGQAVNVNDLK